MGGHSYFGIQEVPGGTADRARTEIYRTPRRRLHGRGRIRSPRRYPGSLRSAAGDTVYL